jgi:hypothetical protein
MATVNPSGAVTLTTSSGHAVTRLRSGRYTLLVSVNSSAAGFRLSGPGVEHSTSAQFTGLAVWGVHFLRGTYRYRSSRGGAAHVISVY